MAMQAAEILDGGNPKCRTFKRLATNSWSTSRRQKPSASKYLPD